MKDLSGSPLLVRLLDQPTNIRQGWKGLLGTNTLAFYEHLLITTVKAFIRLGPAGKLLQPCHVYTF
jgi:hypothetical protein